MKNKSIADVKNYLITWQKKQNYCFFNVFEKITINNFINVLIKSKPFDVHNYSKVDLQGFLIGLF